jgi:hypothetical protein
MAMKAMPESHGAGGMLGLSLSIDETGDDVCTAVAKCLCSVQVQMSAVRRIQLQLLAI